MSFYTGCHIHIERFSQASMVERGQITVILTARGTQMLIYDELVDHVTYETRYSRTIDDNDEMEVDIHNDEKRETDETADDRNEEFCGYQADHEGFGAEECRYDKFQNEAIGQEESSLLNIIGLIMH